MKIVGFNNEGFRRKYQTYNKLAFDIPRIIAATPTRALFVLVFFRCVVSQLCLLYFAFTNRTERTIFSKSSADVTSLISRYLDSS